MDDSAVDNQDPAVYVATAYRWGQLNNHQYTVTASGNRDAVIAAAEDECQGRGLKYGVEVIAYPAEETVAYFPSNGEDRRATGPRECKERNVALRIGEVILRAFQHGVRLAPVGQAIDTPVGVIRSLLDVPAELPAWIAELCKRELEKAH